MSTPEPDTPALHPEDARLLDLLVERGFDPACIETLPAADQPRARTLLRQMHALDAYDTPAPGDALVDAVLARVNRYEADRAAAMRVNGSGTHRRRLRLLDVLSVAAMLMLATSVALPMVQQARARSLRTVCADNLRAVGAGLSSYANEHGGQMVMASLGGGLFGDSSRRGVTPPRPGSGNARNLAKLAQDGYCSEHALQCPGCPHGAACFAYRVPVADADFRLHTPQRMVVAADANPVLELRLNGPRVTAFTLSSRNHGELGQNMLFSDAAVEWHVSPVLGTPQAARFDNIWLPRGRDGREDPDWQAPPSDPTDNFVAQ